MKNQPIPNHVEILIAEDSPTQAEQLKTQLEERDFRVVLARNGRLALEAMKKQKPTLVITDINMPEMDGYDLCNHIRADKELADVPVILLTSMSDPEDVFRGLECGADNFITKPCDIDNLLARIHYLLSNVHLRSLETVQISMEIHLAGQKHIITSSRAQILNLLLSTYEAAIQKNRELASARDDLTKLNSQLTTANKELESFSYSVSHDLRAPLRHILGYANMVLQRSAPNLDETSLSDLKVVSESAKRMGELIDDLLAFSRNSRTELRTRPTSLDDIVEKSRHDLESETEGRNIVWKVEPLGKIQGDPSMLRQVLVNLIGNAIKFTRHRNPAEIEIGCQSGTDQEVVFFVRDNGVGFDMAYSNKLFGVFQRLHQQEDFEGTGIGLANVQRIVHRHGGRTWAEAAVNKGATFYFSLLRPSESPALQLSAH
jgi:two-component system, sensor histidine kinase and response regulator